MSLSNKIMTYRKQHLWSQEDLAEKLGVSRQSVSKWESGTSVPELDKIILLSQLFGITTDELLLDNAPAPTEDPFGFEASAHEPPPREAPALPTVTRNEALSYIEETKKQARRFAPAVAACVFSPTPLILLSGLADTGVIPLSAELGAGLGVTLLLLIIAGAVAVFISGGMALETYKYIQEDVFQPESGLTDMVIRAKEAHTPSFVRSITIGVCLCILGVIPLILGACLHAPDHLILLLVDTLLWMVAIAVFFFVKAGMLRDCYTQLLQLEDYTPTNKQTEKHLGGPYWCLIVAIYLGLSFLTGAWHRTWILWPCAGVLYAALCGILNYRKENK